MNRKSGGRCLGITLIEILVATGVLAILVSFASVSASKTSSRATMRAASENVQYSIDIARRTARTSESTITMKLQQAPGHDAQRITFSASKPVEKSLRQMGIQDYQLNDEITLVSDFPAYEFDRRGRVKNPGQIVLVFKQDESITGQITVE